MNPRDLLRLLGKSFLAVGIVSLLVGCGPGEIVQWSPDGGHALVQGSDGIVSLIDGDGKILQKAPDFQVWLPDSKHAVGVRQTKARDWADYAGLLGKERADGMVRAAEELLSIMQANTGAWKDFAETEPMKRWTAAHHDLTLGVVLYCLNQIHAEAAAPLLKAWRAEEKDENELIGPIYELISGDAFSVEPSTAHILLRSVDEIASLRPSPNGKVVAYAVDSPDGPQLQIIGAEGGDPVLISASPSQADWTADGQQLVYAGTSDSGKGDARLGSICRRSVCDEKGQILPELGKEESLIGILYLQAQSPVACLPDGRILFATLALQLPLLDKDVPKKPTLFILRPDHAPSLKRAVSEKVQMQLPDRVDQFVVSPDSKHVAILGDGYELAVLSLETGDITQLQGKRKASGKSEKFANTADLEDMVPSWRTAKELCYVVPHGAKSGGPRRAEVVLHKLGGEERAISKSWSDEMTDSFLPRLKK